MTTAPHLCALATALPPYRIAQRDVIAHAHALFPGKRTQVERLLPVFENAGVSTRYSCVPLEWYQHPASWRERNSLYIENALDLLEQSAEAALEKAGWKASEVDALVTLSTTGIAVPTLDARLLDRLPFRREVQRLPIFGFGCAGGVLGLSRAAQTAAGAAPRKVLMLIVELNALTFRASDLSARNVVASAIFGDGAAAIALDGDPAAPGPVIAAWGEYTWPDSAALLGWSLEDDGLGLILSTDIPVFLRDELGPVADDFLATHGSRRSALQDIVCHPGSSKVLSALEAIFGLQEGGMGAARRVLRDYGNMSGATVLFILREQLRRGLAFPALMSAVGPGFTSAFLLLEAGNGAMVV
jgi:alkylresorcinol/alkylpyrone synthase